MSVAVITPTIGTDYLVQAMHSVGNKAEHWIIADGIAYANGVASRIQAHPYNQRFIVLPENTGTPTKWFRDLPYPGFFNGYRINAAIPLLISADYTIFLDEDNFFDEDHIESMVKAIEDNGWDWCYSLRKIVDKEGNFLFNDDCDSLGRWPVYKDDTDHLVDMNCYCFKTEAIAQIAHSMYHPRDTLAGDRRLYLLASSSLPNFGCTGKYSVNYRLTRPDQEAWFRKGNALTMKQYNGNFPWSKHD